ncbi:uncharacterized protein SOCE26_029630 [Sorangium cellulosum]|uniref:Uncharacterized protein n=1 Tax=Sorangium cellulosum TaxID=56 RepID=A0A2L0EQG2_SORCE|nr:hypothetical protein [Sorangium cellulosum]AUX41543.1 uncharacterized protein SOCE26_029630 [Sorangium cellulosum]
MSKKGVRSAAEPEQAASETEAALLSLLGEEAARREDRVPLRWGKLLQVTSEEDHERVVLVGATGRMELTLEVTETGARVVIDAEDVALRARRKVAVECDTFEVSARRIEARAKETATIEAEDASIRATVGDLELRANDDVKVDGERVLLNSDGDLRVPLWMKKELGAELQSERREVKVPASNVSGDEDLLRDFERREKGA